MEDESQAVNSLTTDIKNQGGYEITLDYQTEATKWLATCKVGVSMSVSGAGSSQEEALANLLKSTIVAKGSA